MHMSMLKKMGTRQKTGGYSKNKESYPHPCVQNCPPMVDVKRHRQVRRKMEEVASESPLGRRGQSRTEDSEPAVTEVGGPRAGHSLVLHEVETCRAGGGKPS